MPMNLAAELARNGYTRSSFANYMGIGRVTLNRWIKEPYTIPQSRLDQMSLLFNCSKEYLLGETDIKQPLEKLTIVFSGESDE